MKKIGQSLSENKSFKCWHKDLRWLRSSQNPKAGRAKEYPAFSSLVNLRGAGRWRGLKMLTNRPLHASQIIFTITVCWWLQLLLELLLLLLLLLYFVQRWFKERIRPLPDFSISWMMPASLRRCGPLITPGFGWNHRMAACIYCTLHT